MCLHMTSLDTGCSVCIIPTVAVVGNGSVQAVYSYILLCQMFCRKIFERATIRVYG
jgi:hypothetical protein